MLDTDTVSFWFRGDGRVKEKVGRHGTEKLCVSAVTVAELRYGATRRGAARLHQLIDEFTARVAVLPFDGACAIEFGRVGAELAHDGTPIGDLDTMIAAHALTLDLTLVTNNLKHFTRVRGLKVESWL